MTQYLRAANVTWGGLDLSDVKEMDFTPEEQSIYRLHPGDVLLSEASGSAAEVGKPAIWNNELPGCCFQNTLIRVRSEGALPTYLYYHFLSDAVSARFADAVQGIQINHLGAKGLSNWRIRLAPTEEQQRVVGRIESLLARADAVANAAEVAFERVATVDQAILARAFRAEL